MSFMQRYRKQVVIAAIGLGFILLLVAFSLTRIQHAQEEKIREQTRVTYESKIRELETQQQAKIKRVAVVTRDIPSGTTLQAGDIQAIEVSVDLLSSNSVTNPSQLVGKITKIDLSKHTPLIASMVFEEAVLPKNLRFQEFNVIQLPTNLKKDQFVDVRINYPTGQDYIVLAKKKVKELSGGLVWYEMDEKEILMMSSAIIDAYLQGAKLYALTYVDPGMQGKAIANYPANAKVLDLMENDPNLLEKAKNEVARRLRGILDSDLKTMDDTQKMKVTNGNSAVQQQIQNNHVLTEQSNAIRESTKQPSLQSGQADSQDLSSTPQPSNEIVVPTPTSRKEKTTLPQTKPEADKQQNVFEQPASEGASS